MSKVDGALLEVPFLEELTHLLLGFASRFVDWVLVLFGLPRVLLLVLFGRLKKHITCRT